mgnify:CR=1 FL=1
MRTFYSDDHRLHHANAELNNGQLMPCFEKPSRADMVLEQVKRTAGLRSGSDQAHPQPGVCRLYPARLATLECTGPQPRHAAAGLATAPHAAALPR